MRYLKPRWIRSTLLSGSLAFAFCLSASGFPDSSRAQSTASAPPEDAALRAVVEKYFAAYGKKDLMGIVALWSEKSPHLATYGQNLQQQFTTEDLNFSSPAISRVKVESEKAGLRVTIALTSIDLKSHQKSEQRLVSNFEFVKESGEWKVWRYAPAAEDLAEALVKTNSKAERAELLAQEKELVTVELGRVLLTQGRRLYRQGNYARAEEIYELAMELAEQLSDKNVTANALRGIGILRGMQGNYTNALEYFQKTLKIYGEIGDKKGIADTFNNIGFFHMRQGHYTEALEQYQESLKNYEEIGSEAGIAITLNGIGIVYERQGSFAQSLEQNQKSLKIYEKIGDKVGPAGVLSSIGTVYARQGSYAQALERYQKSLKIYEEVGDKMNITLMLKNIGTIHLSQGNYSQALEQYQKCLKIFEELGHKVGIANTLLNLGVIHRSQGNYIQALEQYRKSLKIYEEIGDRAGIASTVNNIGVTQYSQGNYAETLDRYQEGLKIYEESGDKVGIATTLRIIGEVHQARGDYRRALQFAERAADLATQIGLTDGLWEARTNAGKAYFALQQFSQARLSFDQAIAIIETLRANVAGGEQEQQRFFESRVSPYHAMVELLIAQNNPREALIYTERTKARVLLDLLSSGRVNVTKTMTDQEIGQERKLNNQIVSLNTQIYREKQRQQADQNRLSQLESELEKARLDSEAFQTNLYAAHPELQTQRGQAPPLKFEQAGALLADTRTALLEFVVADKKTYLFVLTKTATAAVKVYPLEIKQTDLKDQVERFRRRLANKDFDYQELSRELYGSLLKPAAAELQGKTRLVIVPDGPLWELPFQALQTPRGRYLIDDHTLFYAPSLTVLREMVNARHGKEARSSAAPTLLALGNPALGEQTVTRVRAVLMDEGLDPLPEAEQQVRALRRIYGPGRSKVYVGGEAREERFKAEAKDFRILHLATHCIFNDRSPMYSHLLLAQTGEATEEDGLLEARELMKMDLKADLAVLSACETARGRIGQGEGMIGMTWALFVAGVPTTVVSQWKVRSDSTAELMIEFHRQLKTRQTGSPGSNSAAEALRAAALKLKSDSKYRHPFHWAGFVVMGDGY